MIGTPGHSPDHVTYSIAAEKAIFSGDVLFQGSIGRTDLPGADHATLMALDREAAGHAARRHRRAARATWSPTTLGARAQVQPVPARARRPVSKFQTPRGTYDVLPDTAARTRPAGGDRAQDLRARGLRPDRDADLRGHRAVRARRGRGDRRRAEGDVHLRRRGGRPTRCGPEGTAPVVRAYMEHGMHKLPQPVKLWYLSSFFRRETPQAGPLPPVLADRRGGDRLARPGRRRRGDPAAGGAAGGDRRARRRSS